MQMIVLKLDDLQACLDFEKNLLDKAFEDEMDKELASWSARWRKESLEHYLNLGWSFGIWSDINKTELLGYVLAQPLLFFRGLTQSLWVEHISGSKEIQQSLIEIVYRWSRDKHLQQLIIPRLDWDILGYKTEKLKDDLTLINTTKLR